MEKTNKSTLVIIGLSILVLVLLFVNFKWPKNTVPSNYEEMSPGQLLDAQLVLEWEIGILVDKKNKIQDLRDQKTASIRGQEEVKATGNLETPIEQVNEELDLK